MADTDASTSTPQPTRRAARGDVTLSQLARTVAFWWAACHTTVFIAATVALVWQVVGWNVDIPYRAAALASVAGNVLAIYHKHGVRQRARAAGAASVAVH